MDEREYQIALVIPEKEPDLEVVKKYLGGMRFFADYLDGGIFKARKLRLLPLDPLLGHVPLYVVDLLMCLTAVYVIVAGRNLRLPGRLIARMVANIIVDALWGGIPIAGHLLDYVSQPHRKNYELIRDHLECEARRRPVTPLPTRHSEELK